MAWIHATHNINYLKSIYVYLQDMLDLRNWNPSVHEIFKVDFMFFEYQIDTGWIVIWRRNRTRTHADYEIFHHPMSEYLFATFDILLENSRNTLV